MSSGAVVALPRVFVQPGPAGQLQVALPGVVRARYVTGQQELCGRCEAAGVTRQGVSRDGAGSVPLCMSCWLGQQQRQARVEQAELDRLFWDQIGDLETVADLEQACGACGQEQPSQSCWLCGWAWLRQLRAQFDVDQMAAVEAAECQQELSAECAETEARVADVTGYITRIQTTLALYESGGGGRAVELVADLLARLAVQAVGRTSNRGRPPVTPQVGAVLAVDADWRSGRRSLPGRARTAWLLGCSDRAVHNAWKQVTALKWAKRVRVGGRNSLARRLETGRANDRGEFNLVQLHRSTVPVTTRAAFLAPALELFGELLQRAQAVLEREQNLLDELRARTDTWTDHQELARRAQLRAAVTHARNSLCGPVPAALTAANTCRPHPVSTGKRNTSCSYWGLRFSRKIVIHSPGCGLRPDGRGEQHGASRSPTQESADLGATGTDAGRSRCCDAQPAQRPRTTKAGLRRSHTRIRPGWAVWAPQLARELTTWWPWLSGSPLTWIAAVLGSELSPGWSGETLVACVIDRLGRPVLEKPARPAAYLRSVLAEVFDQAGPPPNPTRRHTQRLRQAAEAAANALEQRQATTRAQLDARDSAAAAATGVGQAQARAALARITGRRSTGRAAADYDWPEVRQPGTGLAHDSRADAPLTG